MFSFTSSKSDSRPILSDSLQPVDYSPPGSSVHGILQVGILEWVASSLFRGFSRPRDHTQISCMAGRFFTFWANMEAHIMHHSCENCFKVLSKNSNIWFCFSWRIGHTFLVLFRSRSILFFLDTANNVSYKLWVLLESARAGVARYFCAGPVSKYFRLQTTLSL